MTLLDALKLGAGLYVGKLIVGMICAVIFGFFIYLIEEEV